MKPIYTVRNGNQETVGFGVTEYVADHIYLIVNISVLADFRHQGHGAAILRNICRDADRELKTLIVTIDPDNPQDSPWITNMFKRNDFECVNENTYMRKWRK